MNKKSRNYTITLFTVSIIALVVVLAYSQDIPYIQILILAIFATIAESLPVAMGGSALSVSSAITLCALLSYGPIAAIFSSVLSIIFRVMKNPETNQTIHIFNTSFEKTMINVSIFTLASTASSFLYIFLGGKVISHIIPSEPSIQTVIMTISRFSHIILATIFIEMLANSLLIAGYRHTLGHGILLHEWLNNFVWSFAGLLVIELLGVLLTAFYLCYGWFMVLLFFAPLFLARYTFSLYSNLRVSYMDTVKSLSDAIEAKDLYTRGHSQRVHEFSAMIADELRYTPKQKETLQYAALLHDVGKIGVTEAILNKPGKLDDIEFDTIKMHPELGARIIANIKYLKDCVPIIKYHHKYYDGSGYPNIATGEKVPYDSYILGVADAFDAMTSKRQYREPFPTERAIAEIRRCTGTQFEPTVAAAFIKAMERHHLDEPNQENESKVVSMNPSIEKVPVLSNNQNGINIKAVER